MPTTTEGSTRRRAHRPSSDAATSVPSIDGARDAFISSATTDELLTASANPWSASSELPGHDGHALAAVEPGFASSILRFGPPGRPVNPLPVQIDKIASPLLRSDTLPRPRLNGWLDRAARARLALVIGELGFGKSTFLADWASRSDRRASWYRLESDDRDWLTFIRHLVAGGREVDEGFAPETYRLLCSLGPGGPTQADLIASVAQEMATFGAAQPNGFSVILDDYEAIESNEETDPIVAALLEATGPGFSLIIAARTAPQLPPVRLGGRQAVQRLDGDQLRFDLPETVALFRDAYDIPLDHDVAVDLVARTEGWAALLSLVRARLEESPDPDPRALVAQLSATDGDLYDYLAEEVLAQAPRDFADFLLRISLLEVVTEDAARVVASDPDRVPEHLGAAERLGILSTQFGKRSQRLSPMVREVLRSQLVGQLGRPGVQGLHEIVAAHFEGLDWRVSASHYVGCGRAADAVRVVAQSIEEVLGDGGYRSALDLLADASEDGAVAAILRSRALLQLGASKEASGVAAVAVAIAEAAEARHVFSALRNAASVAIGIHDYEAAEIFSRRAVEAAPDAASRRLAEAQLELLGVAGEGNLPAFALRLDQLMAQQTRDGREHYQAISALNLAQVYVWMDRPHDAMRLAIEAEQLLARSSGGYELVSVTLARAHAAAVLGRWSEAEVLTRTAVAAEHPDAYAEAVLEAAWIAAWFGPCHTATEILSRVPREALPTDWAKHWRLLDLWLATGGPDASPILLELGESPTKSGEPGAAFRWHLTRARALARAGLATDAHAALSEARRVAGAQGSSLARRIAHIQGALMSGGSSVSSVIESATVGDDAVLGIFGDEVSAILETLSEAAVRNVARATAAAPERWRQFLRHEINAQTGPNADRAAQLLEDVGEHCDVEILRSYARRSRRPSSRWGEALVRRLAPRLYVDDLGLVDLKIGTTTVDGRSIRRKALAFLVFLLSQPSGAATPDQLMDALWPEQDPLAALNSVHQTIYVLRRVIDPQYKAGLSPEYVHFESEMIWLDRELVSSRSWQCLQLLSTRDLTFDVVNKLVAAYRAQFALDFIYDEWAATFRDQLHVAFLGAVAQAVAGNTGTADIRWRLWVGQQVLLVDPEADDVEAQVIGLYRTAQATAAAREQYAHYAATMRDQLGIEPPSIEDV